MKMYKIPEQRFYNDASWRRIVVCIHSSDLESVRKCYSHMTNHQNDEGLLHEAIIQGTSEIVDFFFLQGITAKDEDIEASAIYSHNLDMINHLITKGYTFNSKGALGLAKHYYVGYFYNNVYDSKAESIRVYEFISKRYIIRELYESNEGYLSWLSFDLYERL